jgi:hypothetical protein
MATKLPATLLEAEALAFARQEIAQITLCYSEAEALALNPARNSFLLTMG